MPEAGKDVFISYASADRGWAEWIAWELEDAGYSVVVQAWDFAEGENFLRLMHDASRGTTCTLVVLSPDCTPRSVGSRSPGDARHVLVADRLVSKRRTSC
jgi:hypothetical protein